MAISPFNEFDYLGLIDIGFDYEAFIKALKEADEVDALAAAARKQGILIATEPSKPTDSQNQARLEAAGGTSESTTATTYDPNTGLPNFYRGSGQTSGSSDTTLTSTPTPTPTPGNTLTPDGTVVPKTFKDASGNVKNLDPEFTRNAAAEARAIARGIATKESIEARGGINASGYYGDSYGINSADGVSLTDEEYADAQKSGIGGKSGASGAAINAALAAKIFTMTGSKPKWLAGAIQSAKANGIEWDGPTVEDEVFSVPSAADELKGLNVKNQQAGFGAGADAGDDAGEEDADPKLTAEQKKAKQERQSIITILTDRFNKYGLGSLAKKIKELAVDGASEATISIQLQDTEEYQMRFSANQDRIKKNLRVLSPAEYINVEDSYRQVLRAYGLKQFDNDTYVKQFISNDMSPTELSTRVQTAVQRIQNADPAIGKTLKDFYGIGQADLVGYILDPEASLQKIERQVASAEIGNAARRQGLEAGVAVSEQLAAQGVSEAEAQKGYSTIADILPTAEKLSSIYGTTLPGYGQTEGEQEVFNSLASAQRKRKGLTAAEIASFSGSSGMTRNALTSQNKGLL